MINKYSKENNLKQKTQKKNQKKLHHSWEIKPRLPWYKKLSVLFSFSVLTVSIIGSYLYLNYTLHTTREKLEDVTNSYLELKDNYQNLKIVKIKLQRELEVAKQSQIEVNNNLIGLHQRNQELTEQVDLYKRVTSANRTSESISVANVQAKLLEDNIEESLENNQEDKISEYFVSWVLLQASSNKRNLIEGKLDIKISGKLDDTVKIFNYSQVAAEKNSKLVYKFRDFQQFNKKIKLPSGYNIETITFEMLDNRTKLTKSKIFEWNIIGRQIHVAEAQIQNQRQQSNS